MKKKSPTTAQMLAAIETARASLPASERPAAVLWIITGFIILIPAAIVVMQLLMQPGGGFVLLNILVGLAAAILSICMIIAVFRISRATQETAALCKKMVDYQQRNPPQR